jgi:hypothetical protein
LSLTPSSVTVTAGGTQVTFSATLTSSTATITWTLTGSGTLSTTSGASTSYTPPASIAAQETATITARAGGLTATATITINPLVTLSVSAAQPSVVAGGGPVAVTATLTGSTATITWSLSGVGSLSTTSGTTTNYTPPPSVSVDQIVHVTASAAGKSATADITVLKVALTVTPLSAVVTAGGNAITFTATLTGSTSTIAWSLSGKGSISQTSGVTTSYTPPAAGSVTATETATLTATAGTLTKDVTITINPLVTLSVSAAQPSVVAGGGPVAVTATLTGSTATITWSLSGVGSLSTTSGTTTNYTPPATVTADQSVHVTAAAAGKTATADIIVLKGITLTVSPTSLTVVAGSAATLFTATLSGSSDPITWTLTGVGSISTTSGATTSYTPPASLVVQDTATLTAGAAGKTASASITIKPEPRLSINPTSQVATAGGWGVIFVATLVNSTTGITWVLTGSGRLSTTFGTTTTYQPPATLAASETVTLAARSSGLEVTAIILVNPSPAGPIYPVGRKPSAVAVADLNGDARLDVVTANTSDNNVSVLLANTTGAFAGQVTYAVGTSPVYVAIADLNGDSKPDIVAANSASSTVSVLINKGDGTFNSQVTYAVGTTPMHVAIADIRGNGTLDIVTANKGANSVSVLLGHGDGTFDTKVDYGVGAGPVAAAVADVTGDGKRDIVVANSGASTLSLLAGNGNGTFGAQTTVAAGAFGPSSVRAVDLNNDGRLDLVAAAGTNVSVLLANANGTFATAVKYPIRVSGAELVVADFDGDGKWDVAVGSVANHPVFLLLGKGDGTFAPYYSCWSGGGLNDVPDAAALAAADIDGDGKTDLVVANTSENTVSLLIGNGKGSFAAPMAYSVGGTPADVAIGNLNVDTNPDLVVVNQSSNTVSVLLGNGPAPFSPHKAYAVGQRPSAVAIGDLDGDGKPDLVVSNSGTPSTISVLLNNGDGTFKAQVTYPVDPGPRSVALADLNGDGKLDIVTANTSTGPGTVSVLLGNGNGTFAGAVTYAVGTRPVSVAIGDLNGDNRPDLAVTGGDLGSNTASILLNKGDGTFLAQTTVVVGSTQPTSVALTDLDGDGKLDLVTTGNGFPDDLVSVLRGNGDGTFRPPATFAVQFSPGAVAFTDLNGDGRLDMVVASKGFAGDLGDLTVLTGRTSGGTGMFSGGVPYLPLRSTSAPRVGIAAGDLNGDSKMDVVVTGVFYNEVIVVAGKGDGTLVR